eukprot:GHVN01065742.1.p1 GENE.GHVN01065742.1~~GHVN01065742.1.p1  ORF type:complete len:1310 (+),score=159.59 GHVN01065742.1:359-4288(+)
MVCTGNYGVYTPTEHRTPLLGPRDLRCQPQRPAQSRAARNHAFHRSRRCSSSDESLNDETHRSDRLLDEPFRARIPRTETVPSILMKHTEYVIEIEECFHCSYVSRRFSDFVKLHNELRRVGICNLPELPPKKMLRKMDPEFVERRRQLLETYLQRLIGEEDVKNEDALWEFIRADEATIWVSRFLSRVRSGTHHAHNTLEELIGKVYRVASQPGGDERLKNRRSIDALLKVHSVPNFRVHTYACLTLKTLLFSEAARNYMIEKGALSSVFSMLQNGYPTGKCEAETPISVFLDSARYFSFSLIDLTPSAFLSYLLNNDGLLNLRNMLTTSFSSHLHSFIALIIWMSMGVPQIAMEFSDPDSLGMEMLFSLYHSPNANAKFSCGLMIAYMLSTGMFKSEWGERAACTLESLPLEIQKLQPAFTTEGSRSGHGAERKLRSSDAAGEVLEGSLATADSNPRPYSQSRSHHDTNYSEIRANPKGRVAKTAQSEEGWEDLESGAGILKARNVCDEMPRWHRELDYHFIHVMLTHTDVHNRLMMMLSSHNENNVRYPQVTFYTCWALSVLIVQKDMKDSSRMREMSSNDSFSSRLASNNLVSAGKRLSSRMYSGARKPIKSIPLTPDARNRTPDVPSSNSSIVGASVSDSSIGNDGMEQLKYFNIKAPRNSISNDSSMSRSALTGAIAITPRTHVRDIGHGLSCYTHANLEVNSQTSFLMSKCPSDLNVATSFIGLRESFRNLVESGVRDSIQMLASLILLHMGWPEREGEKTVETVSPRNGSARGGSNRRRSAMEPPKFTMEDEAYGERLQLVRVLLQENICHTEEEREILKDENEQLGLKEVEVSQRRNPLPAEREHVDSFLANLQNYQLTCEDLFEWVQTSRIFLTQLQQRADSHVMNRTAIQGHMSNCQAAVEQLRAQSAAVEEAYAQLLAREGEMQELKQAAHIQLEELMEGNGASRRSMDTLKAAKKKAAMSRSSWMEVEKRITSAPENRRKLSERALELERILSELRRKVEGPSLEVMSFPSPHGLVDELLGELASISQMVAHKSPNCRFAGNQLVEVGNKAPLACKHEVQLVLGGHLTEASNTVDVLSAVKKVREILVTEKERSLKQTEHEACSGIKKEIEQRTAQLDQFRHVIERESDSTTLVQRSEDFQIQVREDDAEVERLTAENAQREAQWKQLEQEFEATKALIRNKDSLFFLAQAHCVELIAASNATRDELASTISAEEEKLKALLCDGQKLREEAGRFAMNRGELDRRLASEKRARLALRTDAQGLAGLLLQLQNQLDKIDYLCVRHPSPDPPVGEISL